MKFTLFLMVMLGDGTIVRHRPTQVDWWTCRIGELRQSSGWTGQYYGNRIIGAFCRRSEEVLAMRQCERAKDCA